MSQTGVRLDLRENWKQFWLLVLSIIHWSNSGESGIQNPSRKGPSYLSTAASNLSWSRASSKKPTSERISSGFNRRLAASDSRTSAPNSLLRRWT